MENLNDSQSDKESLDENPSRNEKEVENNDANESESNKEEENNEKIDRNGNDSSDDEIQTPHKKRKIGFLKDSSSEDSAGDSAESDDEGPSCSHRKIPKLTSSRRSSSSGSSSDNGEDDVNLSAPNGLNTSPAMMMPQQKHVNKFQVLLIPKIDGM